MLTVVKGLPHASVRALLRRLRVQVQTFDASDVAQKMRNVSSPIPVKTLVLCTDERTGSHQLSELLASTGVAGRAYEYFNTPWMKEHYNDYPEKVIDQFAWAMRLGTTENGVFSLKLHPWAMDRISPDIDLCQDLPNPYFISLQRLDLLGQAISLHKAQSMQSFTSWTKPTMPAVYDGARIRTLLAELAMRRERWEVYFARNAITPLRIEYEDLTKQPKKVISCILKFTNIKKISLQKSKEWYRFDRQSDEINDEWRIRFVKEFADTRNLDMIP